MQIWMEDNTQQLSYVRTYVRLEAVTVMLGLSSTGEKNTVE